jgi:hypothetical protein
MTNRSLTQAEYLRSPDGEYTLNMQTDGNLVLYGPGGHAYWSYPNGGQSHPDAYLVLQSNADGNLVLYDRATGAAIWSPGINSPGDSLYLQNDGNLVVYSRTGTAVWATNRPDDTLPPGGDLLSGWNLRSANGRFTLVMQSSDGNLVLYDSSKSPWQALWASGTSGHPGAFLAMQKPDGNAVVYTPSGQPLWDPGFTSAHPGAFLQVLNTGNVAVELNGQVLWEEPPTTVAPFDTSQFNPGASMSSCSPYWNWYSCNNPAVVSCAVFSNGTCGEYGVDVYWNHAGANIRAPESGTVTACDDPNTLNCWNPGYVQIVPDAGSPYPGTIRIGHVKPLVTSGHVNAADVIAQEGTPNPNVAHWNPHLEFMYSPTGGTTQGAFTGGCSAPSTPCGENPSNPSSPWSVLVALEAP